MSRLLTFVANRFQQEYENELLLTEPFNPLREFDKRKPATPPPQPVALTTAEIVKQIVELAKAGVGVGAVSENQLVGLAVAMIPFTNGTTGCAAPVKSIRLDPILGACIESAGFTDLFKTDLRLEQVTLATPAGPQEAMKQEILWQRWEREI